MKTRLILVEDQMLVREGIKSLLGLDDSVEVVGEYENGQQLIDSENALNCDVILMDIRMPKLSGIDTLLVLSDKGINTPVLMLTTFDDQELVNGAMRAGAKGYLLKDVSLETLVDTITQIKNGKTLIQPAVTEKVLQGLKGLNVEFESFENPEPLSEKEVDILRLIAAGYSNKEIADAMFKSTGTIKNQVSSIMAKLGVRDRTRAVLKALEQGII